MEFDKIQYKNMVDMVIDQITGKIIYGQLKAGDKLPTEKEFVELLGVGRSTVREALKSLETIGLIKRSKAGTLIKMPENEGFSKLLQCYISLKNISLHELLDVRLVLETKCVEILAKEASSEDIAKIESLLNDVDGSDDDKSIKYVDFHTNIAKLTKNAAYELLINMLKPVLLQSQAVTIQSEGAQKGEPDMDHRMILDAIKRGDPEKSAAAMRAHLLNVYKGI